MENEIMLLPPEVNEIALRVSDEKREEVKNVLNHVFSGVSKMREQLDSVNVIDENDKVNMKLANTIRLGVREVRLQAEKDFDKKRQEVQMEMISFKTEDSLWLKAKQTMQILTKEIEETAKWKEQTKERIEKERNDLKIQQRLAAIHVYNPEIARFEVELLSDEVFDILLKATEEKYNAAIEAEKQAEEARLKEIEDKRNEDERIRKENERLKAENEAKEKQRLFEQQEANKLIEKQRIAAAKLKAENDAKLKAIEDARGMAEKKANEEKRRLQAKIDAEDEAKLKAEKERIESEKKAAAAPDKEKIIKAVNCIVFNTPECKSEQMKAVVNVINEKFEAFKRWAIEQTNTL